jgi:hypothetical protein
MTEQLTLFAPAELDPDEAPPEFRGVPPWNVERDGLLCPSHTRLRHWVIFERDRAGLAIRGALLLEHQATHHRWHITAARFRRGQPFRLEGSGAGWKDVDGRNYLRRAK